MVKKWDACKGCKLYREPSEDYCQAMNGRILSESDKEYLQLVGCRNAESDMAPNMINHRLINWKKTLVELLDLSGYWQHVERLEFLDSIKAVKVEFEGFSEVVALDGWVDVDEEADEEGYFISGAFHLADRAVRDQDKYLVIHQIDCNHNTGMLSYALAWGEYLRVHVGTGHTYRYDAEWNLIEKGFIRLW